MARAGWGPLLKLLGEAVWRQVWWRRKTARAHPQIPVQFSHSVVSDFVTSWTSARQAFLSIPNSRSLPKLMSVESVMPSSHLIFCGPLLLPPPTRPNPRGWPSLHLGQHCSIVTQNGPVLGFLGPEPLQHQGPSWALP